MKKTVNTYYQKIIDLILHIHKDELSRAKPGHCMKITGLGLNELEFLWDIIHTSYTNIDVFIVSDEATEDKRFISATKLIELRNKEEAPLLALIPSTCRTAAEDSYGSSSFQVISLEGIENKLKLELLNSIPEKYGDLIKSEILAYLKGYEIGTVNIIKYLNIFKK